MIIKLLLKNWKLILDIAIVLLAISLLFLWNPARIFGNGTKLHNTSNMVSEIKAIGELITAEYYGEVIASDEESMLGVLDIDSIELIAIEDYIQQIKRPLFQQYVRESEKVYLNAEGKNFLFEKGRDKYIHNQLIKIKEDIINDLLGTLAMKLEDDKLNALLLYLAIYEHGSSINQKKFVRKSENQNARYTSKVLRGILERELDRVVQYADGDADFEEYLSKGFSTNYRFADFYYDYMEQTLPKKEQKVELALIGRGSVKAGLRFDKLDERNIIYDEDTQTIYLYGFNSEILHADINPWFIPEKRVPGFQIIMAKNASFEQMKELKMHCVDKLRYKADLAGIKQQALENGEVAIAEFFGLLMGKDIKNVVFRGDALKLEVTQIIGDSSISAQELVLIDSLISRELKIIQTESTVIKRRRKELLRSFIQELTAYPIDWKGKRIPYNYFNRHLPTILKDTIVTSLTDGLPELGSIAYTDDYADLKDLKSSFRDGYFEYPKEYQYWSTDSMEYFGEYNQFLNLLGENGAEYQLEYQSRELMDISKQEAISFNGDTILTSLIDGQYLFHFQLIPKQVINELKFDITDTLDLTNDFLIANMTDGAIDEYLLNAKVNEGSELFNYLKGAKIDFNNEDNGFRRFRRAVQIGDANNMMGEVRSKIDAWVTQLRGSKN